MSEQLSLLVLVIALASGLVSSVVTTSCLDRQQPIFFRYLLINILLFNLLILSGLVLRYLQMPLQAAALSSYPGVLPVLFILMASLKLSWLYVFIVMNNCLPADIQPRKLQLFLAKSGVAILLVYITLLIITWFGRLHGLLQFTMSALEIIVVGGALWSAMWLFRTASRLPDGQRRLSIRVFAASHFCLMGMVLFTLTLGWFGLTVSVHLMVNAAFLSLYNIFPLIWLRWFRPMQLASNEVQYDLFGITRREKQIIDLIREGKTNREIADTLFISVATVKDHNHNIFKKCDIRNRLELAKLFQGSDPG